MEIYELQQKMSDVWDDCTAAEFVIEEARTHREYKKETISSEALLRLVEFVGSNPALFDEGINNFELTKSADKAFLKYVFTKFISLKKTARALTKNFTTRITPTTFSLMVVWWIGADQFQFIDDIDQRALVRKHFEMSPRVNCYNIVVPVLGCDKLSDVADRCRFVLEVCNKDFFESIGMPKSVNINEKSFQIHNRETKKINLVKFYST